MNTKFPRVKITTTLGDIVIELYDKDTPVTVKNFLDYVENKFYDGTIFHRVIHGFMIQGGGLTSDMQNKKGNAPIVNEADKGGSNKRGTVAMARTSEINSATSQFFINTVNNDFLDHVSKNPSQYGYCVFGNVVEGMDVVDEISAVKTCNYGFYQDVPETTIEIISAVKL